MKDPFCNYNDKMESSRSSYHKTIENEISLRSDSLRGGIDLE